MIPGAGGCLNRKLMGRHLLTGLHSRYVLSDGDQVRGTVRIDWVSIPAAPDTQVCCTCLLSKLRGVSHAVDGLSA